MLGFYNLLQLFYDLEQDYYGLLKSMSRDFTNITCVFCFRGVHSLVTIVYRPQPDADHLPEVILVEHSELSDEGDEGLGLDELLA